MTKRPATIHSIIPNPLPRPRDSDLPAFRDMKHKLFGILGVEMKV